MAISYNASKNTKKLETFDEENVEEEKKEEE